MRGIAAVRRTVLVISLLAAVSAAGATSLPAQPGGPGRAERPGRSAATAHPTLPAPLAHAAPSAHPTRQGEQAPEEALLGFDPIELIGGSEILGDSQITAAYGGLEYLFVSEENHDLFLTDPERYGIQMGNLCARLGRTTGGDQDLYTVFEGRIYIFAAQRCVELFEAAPHRYLPPSPEPPLRDTSSPEALVRGRELIALAVEALGGAAALDATDNLVEEVVLQRPAGGALTESTQIITLDLAHRRLRRERRISAGSFIEALSPAGSWWRRGDYEGDYSPAQAENLAKELEMPNPLYILGMRGSEDFVAASLGTGSADVLEHVAVQAGEERWTLGIEPVTGMLASITFVDRGPEGNWGEITHFLTDYRVVGGINWPHRRVVIFDGEMVPWWNTQTHAVRLNAELSADLFARPAGLGSE